MKPSTIANEIRLMTASTRADLKKVARMFGVTTESMVWMLADVFSDGTMRSHAYSDVPAHVIDDGLAVERFGSTCNYTPWEFTFKGKEILAKVAAVDRAIGGH